MHQIKKKTFCKYNIHKIYNMILKTNVVSTKKSCSKKLKNAKLKLFIFAIYALKNSFEIILSHVINGILFLYSLAF